jgi:hypothetical protein
MKRLKSSVLLLSADNSLTNYPQLQVDKREVKNDIQLNRSDGSA